MVSALIALTRALYVSTNPLTPDFRAELLVATEIVMGIKSFVSVRFDETDSNLILTPLTASSMVLLLDSISSVPSIMYLAFFGVSTTVEPISMPESPDSVKSDPTPIAVDVSTRRDPEESVRMLALRPDVEN
ncbi:hypothetical protein D3C81_1942440 [compost metagenome]